MCKNLRGRTIPCVLQHGGPEECMKIKNILADKMIELCCRTLLPVFVEINTPFDTEFLETAHVTDRGIQPHIKIFICFTGNFEPEIRGVTRNIPVRKFILPRFTQPLRHFVSSFRLEMLALSRPAAQKIAAARIR